MTKWINLLLRLIIGGIFVVAGAVKIVNPAAFADSIANYRMLPHEWINAFAITLPWVEVAAGLLLIIGIWMRTNALLIALMLVMFIIAIGQAVGRGLNIECGCFGTVEGRKVGLVALAEDAAMLAAAAWLAWREKD
jgi:uncharacterized membrane protein YphA (DoxX/SURF4 family)